MGGRSPQVPAFPKFSRAWKTRFHRTRSLLQGPCVVPREKCLAAQRRRTGRGPGCPMDILSSLGVPWWPRHEGIPAFFPKVRAHRLHSAWQTSQGGKKKFSTISFRKQQQNHNASIKKKNKQSCRFPLNESVILQLLHMIQKPVLFLL